MSEQILMFTTEREPEESADERLDGLMYNALYGFELAVTRAENGVLWMNRATALNTGLKTAKLLSSKSYGRYTPFVIKSLIARAEKLITEERKAA